MTAEIATAAICVNRPSGQSPYLAGGFVLVEQLHTIQLAAQEMLGQFARQNSKHPAEPAGIDGRMPPDILNSVRSDNHKLGGSGSDHGSFVTGTATAS